MRLSALLLLGAFATLPSPHFLIAAEQVVTPQEETAALRNPQMGLQSGWRKNPLGSVQRTYIEWNKIENAAADSPDKIKTYCDQLWSEPVARGCKIIPRVYLRWPKGATNDDYWPADLNAGDWTSDAFRSRLRRLIQRLGQQWDQDPRIAAVEMGMIGLWGEQHDPWLNQVSGMEQLLGEEFTAAFPNKPVMRRYPADFKAFAFGVHWDSFAHPDEMSAHVPALEAAGDWWKRRSGGGEPGYNWGGNDAVLGADPDATMRTPAYWNRMVNYIRRLHWNNLGWVSDYDFNASDTAAGAAAVQRALGYRLIITRATMPERVEPGARLSGTLTVVNAGSAPLYTSMPLEVSLLDPVNGALAWSGIAAADSRTWLPGDDWQFNSARADLPGTGYGIAAAPTTVSYSLPLPATIPVGTYHLAVALLDPAGMQPAVHFAIRNYYAGGRHPLATIGIGANRSTTALRTFAAHGTEVLPYRGDAASVRLQSAQAGTKVTSGGAIALSASATRRGAALARIEFWQDGVKVAEDTSEPYTASIISGTHGSVVFNAVAIDTAGVRSWSLPVSVTVVAAGLPAGWTAADCGTTGAAGSSTEQGGTFTLRGAGADIWGSADSFQFASQSFTGDGTITARVATLQGANVWAKAGVMIRESTASGARHAFACVTSASGVAFQRRTTANGTSDHTAGSAARAPRWVRLVRSGTTITGYESADGVTWTNLGATTIGLGNPVRIGLAVTSHEAGTLATATFDQVTITPAGNG